MLKTSVFLILFAGLMACSPVRFSAKSTSCTDPACLNTPTPTWPPEDGTSVWKVGAWGMCSQACGVGQQSREVTCVNKNNQLVPEERCKEAKPAATQECNGQSCGGSPAWNVGSWGDCNATCGGGNQFRTVECRDTTGVKPDSSCTGEKPATQQVCNTQACSCNPIDKSLAVNVPTGNNQVDILIVVDDSSSMTPDNTKLSQRLNGFVTDLQSANIDWQMCITTTDVSYYEGRPIKWSGTNSRILTKATANLSAVFQQTINDLGSGYSNDEQGIKASILSMLNNPVYPCYRSGSAFAAIIISDEDERSVGGNQSLSSQQYQALGVQNLPSTFVNTANAVFGAGKRMAVNSIVVPDNQCKQSQDTQGSLSFVGTKYIELANMTSGTVGNICDSDYSTNLKYFKDAIVSTVSSVDLECVPSGTPVVTLPSGYTWTLSGSKMTFTPALAPGVNLTVQYKCCP
ncbi:MAG: hypothetical protein RJB66_2728 [Pseudomonadota bacterium]